MNISLKLYFVEHYYITVSSLLICYQLCSLFARVTTLAPGGMALGSFPAFLKQISTASADFFGAMAVIILL